MKKELFVFLVVAIATALAAFSVQAGWDNDPDNDPVYKAFLEDTADIRKEIAMEKAELNALMEGENPDPVQIRKLSTGITEKEQKLLEIASENGFGISGNGGGGCGGSRTAQGSCGGCGRVANTDVPGSNGYGSCGTPGCPGAAVNQ